MPDAPSPTDRSPHWRRVVGLFLLGTLTVGVWLRWALAGATELPVDFAHLRHAHSHLGYFGVLFPLAWMGLEQVEATTPGPRLRWAYALSTLVATVGFIGGGYGPVAIAGCTAVAAVWLIHAAALSPRMRHLEDPLGAVPLGLLLSLACVPPVAINLRTDPELAHGFVSTFLAGLLFTVLIPACLARWRVFVAPWPFLLAAAALGALALGVWSSVPARLGLIVLGGLLAVPAASTRLPGHLRTAWALVGLGLVALALGLLPNSRPVALGAIHFLVLGPVLASLVPAWLSRPPSDRMWWGGHACWGAMAGALVLQGLGAGAWTWTAAAAGGTASWVWWVMVLVGQLGPTQEAPEGVQMS